MPASPNPLILWNVTVEFHGALTATPIDGGGVESLVNLLSEYKPMVSHLPRRWTMRLTIYASEPLEAASEAIEVSRKAAADAGLPDWPVGRVEAARGRT